MSRRPTSRSSSNPARSSAGDGGTSSPTATPQYRPAGPVRIRPGGPRPRDRIANRRERRRFTGIPAWGWQERVEVKPGQTARVQIGGKGRPVIGRVVVDGTPETPVDWTKNQPVVIQVPLEELKDSLDWRRFASHIDKDGRFRIEDVPPGKYVLEVTVNGDSYPQVWHAEAVTGIGERPSPCRRPRQGRPDEPFDLGTITVELFETLKVGDRAPEFTVPRIAGKGRGDQLRLSDYPGKLVLLDYWATWCGPCLAEMPAIKDIQKTFGGDPRFQLIGLSCDETAEAAERYIKENGLIWTHGFAGNLLAGVNAGKVYKVRAIPATFLIGPDGRILAKNLRGAELKEAVRKALENPKLFPTEPASRWNEQVTAPCWSASPPGYNPVHDHRSWDHRTPQVPCQSPAAGRDSAAADRRAKPDRPGRSGQRLPGGDPRGGWLPGRSADRRLPAIAGRRDPPRQRPARTDASVQRSP